jgi:recombination protein RecA
MAPPFRQAEFDIIYGEGISHQGNLLDLGLERGMVLKSGSYFSFGEERLGQGRTAARAFLREHPDIADTLEAMIRKDAAPQPAVVAEVAEVEEDEEVLAGHAG